jgi:hypothetical protein
MSAAEAMVFARLGFAVDCVAVGDFAFCHGCEATILAFGIALSSQHSAFSPENIFLTLSQNLETKRKGGTRGELVIW